MRPSFFVGLAAAFSICATLGATACGEEDVNVRPRLTPSEDGGGVEGGLGCGVAVPSAYVSPNFAANAAAELALGTTLIALDAKMASTEGATPTGTATAAELAALYNSGSPSLRAISTSASQATVDGYLAAFGAAQGQTWEPANAQADGGAATGGKFKDLFYESATGVDLRAATVKAVLGGALFNQAVSVAAQGLTPNAVDKLVALFGASTALANRTDVGAGTDGDRFVAELASKRDDDTKPTGIYRRVRTALLTLKVTVGNDACQADTDAALNEYFLGWEQATYASAIYALNSASTTAVNPDSAALTLHSYGEALGLVQSFKGLGARRKITDAQIDLVLSAMKSDIPYTLATDPGTRILDLTSAINNIAAFESFDPASVESFKQSF